MENSHLDYVYVVSERQRLDNHWSAPEYKGFAFDGLAAQSWCQENLDVTYVDRLKERVVELDAYIGPKPSSRTFHDFVFLIEALKQDVWLVEGYLHCEKSAKALIHQDSQFYRYTALQRITH